MRSFDGPRPGSVCVRDRTHPGSGPSFFLGLGNGENAQHAAG